MKKLFLAALATLSLNAFAESFVVMDNGIVVTTDASGFAYDFGHYAFPQKITLKGGRFFVEENKVIATVDENGLLFRKYEVIPTAILGKGINYFLSESGSLFTIDEKGVLTIAEHPELKDAMNFGGNYFLLPTDAEKKTAELYTVHRDGTHAKAVREPLKLGEIVAFGGTYFMNNRGIVTTISADGVVAPQPLMRVGVLVKRGGNYFVDSSNTIFTVAHDGTLKVPGIPVSLKTQNIVKLGSDYFLDLQGRFYTVDRDGNVWEREVKDIDFKHARVLSL